MEDSECELIRSRLYDLILVTHCNSDLLTFLSERKILALGDMESIAAKDQGTERAAEFYKIIQTRTNAFALLLEGLQKTGQTKAFGILRGNDIGRVALSNEEIRSRVRKLLGEDVEPKKKTKLEEASNIKFDVIPPVHLFTGRRKELSEIHQFILRSEEASRVFVISQLTSVSGLGGIGKTQLARQYVLEKGNDFFDGNCIWLNAETEVSLSEGFRRLATDKLGMSTKDGNGDEKSMKSVVEDVYSVFDGRKALFVFDNAEKVKFLKPFLPLTAHNSNLFVLITSRDREWDRGIKVLDLREFSVEDAVAFVVKGLEIEEVDENKEKCIISLVNRLQCFPLALHQAISYIYEQQQINNNYSIQDYLQEFEEMQVKLLSFQEEGAFLDEYTKTTYTTWKITTDKIERNYAEHGKLALHLLNIMAYMNPSKIERRILSNNKYECDEGAVKYAVRLLIKYSMVNGEDKQRILNVHRLVQEVTRVQLDESKNEDQVLDEVIQLLRGTGDEYPAESVEHAMVTWKYAWKHFKLIKQHSKQIIYVLVKMDTVGLYNAGVTFAKEALENVKPCLSDEYEDYLEVQRQIGHILSSQGKWDEALDIFKTISDRTLSLFGENHESTLNALQALANALWGLNRLEESAKLEYAVYQKRVELNGPNDISTLKIQQNYAISLRTLGRLNEAMEIYKLLADKYVEVYEDENHVEVLNLRQNIAAVHMEKGHHQVAIIIYKDVFEIIQPKWKDDVELFATVSYNLGYALNKAKRNDEALEVLENNYETIKEVLGEDHYTTLGCLQLIGDVFQSNGRTEEALEIHKKVYQAFIPIFAEDHDHVEALSAKARIAIDLSLLGRHDEALFILKEIVSKLEPASYSYVIETKLELALAIERSGENLGSANELLLQVQEIVIKVCGEESPRFKDVKETFERIQQKMQASIK